MRALALLLLLVLCVLCAPVCALSVREAASANDALDAVDACGVSVLATAWLVYDSLDPESLRMRELVRATTTTSVVQGADKRDASDGDGEVTVHVIDVRNEATAWLLPVLNIQAVPALRVLRCTRSADAPSLVKVERSNSAVANDRELVLRLARLARP